jgi:hypothetical protein
VDTYLRFAEAVNRLDLSAEKEGLPGLVSGAKESGAKRVTKGVLEGVGEKLRDVAESESQRPSGRTRSRGSGQRPRLPPAHADGAVACLFLRGPGRRSRGPSRGSVMATEKQKEAGRRNIAKARQAQSTRAHGAHAHAAAGGPGRHRARRPHADV